MTQEEIRVHVLDILGKAHLMSLATIDESGPWVSAVIFIYDDALDLYWLSDLDTRHSRAVLKDGRVAATITVSNKSKEPNEGLQVSGRATKIEGEVRELAAKQRTKRGKSAPQPGEIFLDPNESWYRLTPEKIELIYEPTLGFTKVKLEL